MVIPITNHPGITSVPNTVSAETKKEDSLQDELNAVCAEAGIDPSTMHLDQCQQHISKGGATFYLYNISDEKISFNEDNELMIGGSVVLQEISDSEAVQSFRFTDDDGVMVAFMGAEGALHFYTKDFGDEDVENENFVKEEGWWVANTILLM